MDAEVQHNASELVLSLSDSAPSDAFFLSKRQGDGSIAKYPIRVRYLRTEQEIMALIEAQKYATKVGEIKGYGDVYQNAQAVELLRVALCEPEEQERDDGTKHLRPLFVTSQQLRESFTSAEMAQCLNMYEFVKAKYSCIEDFSLEAIDTWAARLSDTLLGPLFLVRLDSSQWPALLMSLASRVRDLSEKTGQPLPSLHDSSESDPESSDTGTGGFTSLPSAVSSEGVELPTTHVMSKEEARAKAKELREKAGNP